MGLNDLDLMLRSEKAFQVTIPRDSLVLLMRARQPADVTAGEFHDYLCDLCRSSGRSVPQDSWERCRQVLADALGASQSQTTRDSLLKRDLGM